MPNDSVRVVDNQRLDKPDFDAITELLYRGMRESFGGLLGGASGLLSPLAYTLSDDGSTYHLTLDKLVLAWGKTKALRTEARGLAGSAQVESAWESVIFAFDPDDTGHLNHPIDYTAARTAEQAAPGTKPYIWVRPITVPSDTDTRKVWSTEAGTESDVATATRNRQRLEFTILSETPAEGIGGPWSRIARVMSWAGDNISSIAGLSVWDHPDTATMLQDPGDVEDVDTDNASFAHPLQRLREGSDARSDGSQSAWPAGTRRSAGLPYALQWIMSRLQRHISGGTSDHEDTIIRSWWDEPEISLNGAKHKLDALETDATALSLRVDKASQRQEVLCSGIVYYYPDATYAAPDDTEAWGVRDGWGIESVTGAAVTREGVSIRFKDGLITDRTTWYVSGVQVTPILTGGRAGATKVELVAQFPNVEVGNSTWGGAPWTLSQWVGPAVGLGAGEYGMKFLTHVTTVAGGVLSVGAPLLASDLRSMAWSVTVFISKFDDDDAGI